LIRPWAGALIAVVAAFYLFLLADPAFISVDKRIYTHYTASLVDDLDLNVINQIPAKEAWLLSKSLNYPDVHSNGAAVLWAPFFLMAKQIKFGLTPAPGGGHERMYGAAQAVANVFWGMAALILLWFLLRRFYPRRVCVASMILLAACTPLLWYLVGQPGNADMTSLFLEVALLGLFCGRDRISPAGFSFLFGFALFTAVAVKFDAVFNGLLFALFLFEHRRHGARRLAVIVAAFAAGALLPMLAVGSNESLKNGFADYTYFDTVTSQFYLLWENLFAPSGYLVTEPFTGLLLLTFLVLAWRRKAPAFYVVLALIPVVELLLESFNYNQSESLAARHWVNDTGALGLVLAWVLVNLRDGRERFLFYFGGALCAAVLLAATVVYRFDFDAYFFTGRWRETLLALPAGELFSLFRPHALTLKLILSPLIGAALLALGALAYRLRSGTSPRFYAAIFAAVGAAYIAAALLNLRNNARSAALVPLRVEAAVIGGGPHINSFFENAGCLQRAAEFYRRRGDLKRAALRQAALEDYALRAATEIVRDPVGFRATLRPGRATYVPDELWTDQ
jgi:hypothetical protein